MNGTLALAMAVSGGFFGTMVALTVASVLVRIVVVRAFAEWMRGPHERGECPVCKRPMVHRNVEGS